MELLICDPKGASKVIALRDSTFSVGRATDNDLAYPEDPWLSRNHLCFERHENQWFVKDCASRNGTRVNSAALKGELHKLRSGDRIHAGHLIIDVRGDRGDTREIVSWVPDDEHSTHEATIVTSLDRVLNKQYGRLDKVVSETGMPITRPRDTTLSTTRAVTALIRAGQELAGHRPLEELFAVIMDLALSAVEARRGVILTLEGDELTVRASRGDNFVVSTSVRDRVLRERCSVMISDAQVDAGLAGQQSIVAQRVRSIIAAPLQTGDRVIGLIYVDNGAFVRPFHQEDLDLITVMANVAAIRIEHARLATVEEAERLMANELAQASELQHSLLPEAPPRYSGWDVAGFNLPCLTVGGDYYDFLPYSDGRRLGLVVGDVSGKGMPAALLMSSLQARVEMLSETGPDPAFALDALNRNLAKRCPLGKFITFFYGVLDTVTGHLLYSNAGHNYPLLLRSSGEIEQLSDSSMVMGLFPSTEYNTRETVLDPGDMLVLFSDGVTEARTPETSEEFGDDRLAEFLRAHQNEPCAEIVKQLVLHVRAWCRQSAFADDFTVVLARREPIQNGDH